MTVNELIEKLRAYDGDQKVCLSDEDMTSAYEVRIAEAPATDTATGEAVQVVVLY